MERGPRSEPPMPTWIMVRNFSPCHYRPDPFRPPGGKSASFSSSPRAWAVACGFGRGPGKEVATGGVQHLPVFTIPTVDTVDHRPLPHGLELLDKIAFIREILQCIQHLIRYSLHGIEHFQRPALDRHSAQVVPPRSEASGPVRSKGCCARTCSRSAAAVWLRHV